MPRTPRHSTRRLAALLLALALLAPSLALSPAARAADCTATSTANGGTGTLRAILAGNCTVITFQAGLGAITLTQPLAITRTVEIRGPGMANQTIRGTTASRW